MAILTAGVSSGGENDVLYWMVDDTAQVTKDVISYYYGLKEADDIITGTASTPDAGITNEW